MDRLIGLLGIVAILGFAYLLSNNKKAINWKQVAGGLSLQFGLALLILKVPGACSVFEAIGSGICSLLSYAMNGADFVLGKEIARGRFVFIINIGASIIFVTILTSLLYYIGVMEVIIKLLARVLMKTMGISAQEAISTVAAVFIGQVECQTTIMPYLKALTPSQLFTVIAAAMATISGSSLVAYTSIGMNATWLLAASFMSAVGGIVTSKIMWPETNTAQMQELLNIQVEKEGTSLIDAIVCGARKGAKITGLVMLMVFSFVVLISFANGILGNVLSTFGVSWQLQDIFGALFTPIAWLLGTPWHDAFRVGRLMATEILINEFIAYDELSQVIHNTGAYTLGLKSQLIATMALCGFANLSSIGINIGGLSAMAPERSAEINKMAFKALIAANFATWITAAIAGLLF